MCYHSQNADDVLRFSLSAQGAAFELAEHFRLVEFASRDGADEVLIHPALLLLVERVRREFDRPVHINSGYRSPAHNRAIGGAMNSKHVLGMAADMDVRGVGPDEVATFCESIDAGGVGRYATFTHADVFGRQRRWDNR